MVRRDLMVRWGSDVRWDLMVRWVSDGKVGV